MTSASRIVRARSPLRLGLAGGGTDLAPYCDLYGGAVLNVTIDRSAFVSIHLRDDDQIEFVASDLSVRESFAASAPMGEAKLKLHRGVYERMIAEFNDGVPMPMTIHTDVQVPAGSGLGSSSALMVTLVDAFRLLLGAPLGQYDVAHLAFEIERIDLALAGGKQDQYAAAFGGVNFIEFLAGDRVIVNPLRISQAILRELESRLVTCFSGISRHSADIIERQTSSLKQSDRTTVEAMHQLKSDSLDMKRALLVGNFGAMAEIMNHSWLAKKATASLVSSTYIEELFDHAMENGAAAGKVSGAGGGGFMIFLVDPPKRHHLIQSLREKGADANPVVLSQYGCQAWDAP